MTLKKSVSTRLQETLSRAAVPSLRIAVPALSISAPSIPHAPTETAKRREMLAKCQNDLERIIRDERRYTSTTKSAA